MFFTFNLKEKNRFATVFLTILIKNVAKRFLLLIYRKKMFHNIFLTILIKNVAKRFLFLI